MTRVRRAIIRNFALHVDVGEGALQLGAQGGDNFAYRVHLAPGNRKHQPELLAVGHGGSVVFEGSVTQRMWRSQPSPEAIK